MLRWGLCEFGRRQEVCADSLDHLFGVSFGGSRGRAQERDGGVHTHSDSSIVARAREHARIGRIPSHGVDAACSMTFECLDEVAVFFVPYINFGICSLILAL